MERMRLLSEDISSLHTCEKKKSGSTSLPAADHCHVTTGPTLQLLQRDKFTEGTHEQTRI